VNGHEQTEPKNRPSAGFLKNLRHLPVGSKVAAPRALSAYPATSSGNKKDAENGV